MTGFPLQIEADVRRRLAALGVKPGEIEERFVRGAGPGGRWTGTTKGDMQTVSMTTSAGASFAMLPPHAGEPAFFAIRKMRRKPPPWPFPHPRLRKTALRKLPHPGPPD